MSAAHPTPLPLAGERAREAFFASFSRELRWSLDDDGRFSLVEGAWQSVLGWRPERLRGRHWKELVHHADHARLGEALERLCARGGCERDLEIRLALATGGHRVMTWTLIADSGPDSVLGLGHDRTLQAEGSASPALLQHRNRELSARLEELEERYAAVERFAGTAAHQLSEPLVIAESSAILVAEELGDDLDPMLRGRLDAIGRSAARARRLMDTLLADARSDGQALALKPVDLGTVVQETLSVLEAQIEARRAAVVVEDLPTVHGEPGLLGVVIENLISNALKYGPRSGGTVALLAEPQAGGWRVSVSSEGPPIPAEEVRRIFQPFHRAPGEGRMPGVGLGLAICVRLVERLGGRIGMEPAAAGNTFWFELPAAD